jgi:hypothetical protein
MATVANLNPLQRSCDNGELFQLLARSHIFLGLTSPLACGRANGVSERAASDTYISTLVNAMAPKKRQDEQEDSKTVKRFLGRIDDEAMLLLYPVKLCRTI